MTDPARCPHCHKRLDEPPTDPYARPRPAFWGHIGFPPPPPFRPKQSKKPEGDAA
jgi:hypothetical protein